MNQSGLGRTEELGSQEMGSWQQWDPSSCHHVWIANGKKEGECGVLISILLRDLQNNRNSQTGQEIDTNHTHAHSEHTYAGREPCGHARGIGWVLKQFHFIKLQCFPGCLSQLHRSCRKHPRVLLFGRLWNVLSYSALSLTRETLWSLTNTC